MRSRFRNEPLCYALVVDSRMHSYRYGIVECLRYKRLDRVAVGYAAFHAQRHCGLEPVCYLFSCPALIYVQKRLLEQQAIGKYLYGLYHSCKRRYSQGVQRLRQRWRYHFVALHYDLVLAYDDLAFLYLDVYSSLLYLCDCLPWLQARLAGVHRYVRARYLLWLCFQPDTVALEYPEKLER